LFAAYQEPGEGQHVFPILGAGPMHENDRGMFPSGGWADERSLGLLNPANSFHS
jgi:hypothetical protein